jgi:hypothetical protein
MNVNCQLLHLYGLIGLHIVIMKRLWMEGDDRNLVPIFIVAIGGLYDRDPKLKKMVGHLCLNDSLVRSCKWPWDQPLGVCLHIHMAAASLGSV